jgi:hypothetical protein
MIRMAFALAIGAAFGQQLAQMASETSAPSSAHCRAAVTLWGAPQLTETSTFWMRMSAWFSAAATLRGSIPRPCSRLVTVPASCPGIRARRAQDLHASLLDAADQTNDLRRADIERRDKARSIGGRLCVGCAHANRFAHYAAVSPR